MIKLADKFSTRSYAKTRTNFLASLNTFSGVCWTVLDFYWLLSLNKILLHGKTVFRTVKDPTSVKWLLFTKELHLISE